MKSLVLGAAALLAALGSAAGASAQSAVTLTATSGHPSGGVVAAGSGFGASEAVDLYFDTTDTQLLVSSSSGAFSGLVSIPATAQPGTHYVTAIGRRTGDAAQIAYQVTTPWSQFGYGGVHRSLNPYENTISTANVGQLGEVWQAKLVGSGATPVVVNGSVFLTTEQGVQARVASTGVLKWNKLTTSVFYSSPAAAGSYLYVGSTSNILYALSQSTGNTRWSQALGGSVYGSPVVSNGVVYVATFDDDKVSAFQASSGSLIWTFTAGGGIDATPVVMDGVGYIGSYDGKMYALDATTGAVIFTYSIGSAAIESSAVVANGVVYFGADDSKIYALSAASGGLIWSYTTGGAVYGSPAVSNGTLYEGSNDGYLYALDLRTGALRWKVSLGALVRSVSVANGIVYVTAQTGFLTMLDASYGGILASVGGGNDYLGAPAISDGRVFLNASGGSAYAFGLQGQVDARKGGPPLPASLHPDLSLTARR